MTGRIVKNVLGALFALAVIMPVAAQADTLFEVEHARAIDRAGGPISEYNAELLDRWGTTSGSYYSRYGRTYRERPSGRRYRPGSLSLEYDLR